jgi:hypothetical protein
MTSKMPSRADELNKIESSEIVYSIANETKSRREWDEVNSDGEGTLTLTTTRESPRVQPQLGKDDRAN